jgi:hypothetical protein
VSAAVAEFDDQMAMRLVSEVRPDVVRLPRVDSAIEESPNSVDDFAIGAETTRTWYQSLFRTRRIVNEQSKWLSVECSIGWATKTIGLIINLMPKLPLVANDRHVQY